MGEEKEKNENLCFLYGSRTPGRTATWTALVCTTKPQLAFSYYLFLSPTKSFPLPSLFPCAFCHPIRHAPVCGLFCDAKLKSRHKLDFFCADSFVQFSYTRESYDNWFLLFLIELGNLLCNKELTCPIALPKRNKEKK